MEGYRDPFCRKPYPWGREDQELLAHYRLLGQMRLAHPALNGGSFRVLEVSDHHLVYEREKDGDRLVVIANRGVENVSHHLPGKWEDLLTGDTYSGDITLAPDAIVILNRKDR